MIYFTDATSCYPDATQLIQAAKEPNVTMIIPPANLFRPDDAQRSRVVKSRGSSGPRSSIDAMDPTLPMFTAFFNSLLQHKSAPALAPPVTPHSRKRNLSPTPSPAGPPSSLPLLHRKINFSFVLKPLGKLKTSQLIKS